MKKIIIGSSLILASMSAYATSARLLALGMNETDNDGMYIVQDSRNIFLNPAYVNVYSNQAVFEYGGVGTYATASTTGGASDTTVWSTNKPKATGGFFKKYNDNVFGLYIGNESNTSSLLRAAATSTVSAANKLSTTKESKMLKSSDNQLDLFWGFERGLKYGFDLIFAKGKDESRSGEDSALALRTGVVGTGWDAHLNLSLGSKSKATDNVSIPGLAAASDVTSEFKGKFGIQFGGSYKLNVGKVFGYAKHFSWEQSDSYNNYSTLHTNATGAGGATATALGTAGQNGTVNGDFTSVYAGWGDEYKVNGNDSLFVQLTAKQTSINLKFSNKTEIRHLVIPISFGYEAKANEWLTLRGSIIQNLWGTRDNKNENSVNPVAKSLVSAIYGSDGKATIANTTTVNAGATMAFGNLSVDGLIGATSGARNGSVSSSANTNNGALAFDNFSTTVGMTYNF